MSERRSDDRDEERWLGARWSAWGCAAVVGSFAIAALAIVTIIYGMQVTPSAFGPEGVLSPHPDLQPPFDLPPEHDELVGIPPVGLAEFTTGHPLRLAPGILFEVTETAFDWSPPPPQTPEVEYTVARVRLENRGDTALPLSPAHFELHTAWAWEAPLPPVLDLGTPGLLAEQSVAPGRTAEGVLVFARRDLRQVRRHLLYRPPFLSTPVKVVLIP